MIISDELMISRSYRQRHQSYMPKECNLDGSHIKRFTLISKMYLSCRTFDVLRRSVSLMAWPSKLAPHILHMEVHAMPNRTKSDPTYQIIFHGRSLLY